MLNSSLNKDAKEVQSLTKLVQEIYLRGHCPATSGNYSLRSQNQLGGILMSESGVDKSLFAAQNLILVDENNVIFSDEIKNSNRKTSDEAELHLAIYKKTNANCVIHSHLLEALLFTDLFPEAPFLEVQDLEILKGFPGIKTHHQKLTIPCVDNTQDIKSLALSLETTLSQNTLPGFIIRGHGFNVWGSSVSATKRHLEVFEYIFKYYFNKSQMRKI